MATTPWSIFAEGPRIVSVYLPAGAVITRMDAIAMGPQTMDSLAAWCRRHGKELLPYGDGFFVAPQRPQTVCDFLLGFVMTRPAA